MPRASGSYFLDAAKNKFQNHLSTHFIMGMRSRARGLKVLSSIAVLSTFTFLIEMLVYLSQESVKLDSWLGIRSVIAPILPIFVMAYLGNLTRISQNGNPNQSANVFIIYLIWTLMLPILDRSWDFGTVPVVELLVSATFASIFWRSKNQANRSNLFACCYGV